jgi:hypothetical protein
MKGDFSRITFDERKRFLRVLLQQGRVQLDADWNEQISILLYYLQTLASDLIGQHAGWSGYALNWEDAYQSGDVSTSEDTFGWEGAFRIVSCLDENDQPVDCAKDDKFEPTDDFYILPGHYYVDGILCENNEVVAYSEQTDRGVEDLEEGKHYLVYLDVWERHITYIEDETETIREVALGGPDTATRSKVVWLVKTHELPGKEQSCNNLDWDNLVQKWQAKNRGMLKAWARVEEPPTDPCIIPPEAQYRGDENQLYRVEIHKGGKVGEATFKWSRDNGSVALPIRTLAGEIATLEHMGYDDRFDLEKGDWVEILDDDYDPTADDNYLFKIKTVDRPNRQVTFETAPGISIEEDSKKHPLLRRWDHREGRPETGGLKLEKDKEQIVTGAALIREGEPLNLEDGIQIEFQPGATYRAGDYWQIPARTATGDIEWPRDSNGNALECAPHGVDHHYAPLAIIELSDRNVNVVDHCRLEFMPLWRITAMLRANVDAMGRIKEDLDDIKNSQQKFNEDLKKYLERQQEIEKRLKRLEEGEKEIIERLEPAKPARKRPAARKKPTTEEPEPEEPEGEQ